MFTRYASIVTVSLLLVFPASAGPIISDGNMDALTVGTNPDNGLPAGAWLFPQNYIDAGLGEVDPLQFTIVQTADFDPERAGNSLGLNSAEAEGNFHLTNLLNDVIEQAEGFTVEVGFEIFLPERGIGGGSIYIGGDHGGGGFSNATDRGPQLSWLGNGTVIISPGDVVIVDSYGWDRWQSVLLSIDLIADTFDMSWAEDDEPLELVGTDLPFRSGALDFLDRFSYVQFTGLETPVRSYIDNVTFEVIPEPASLTLLALGSLVALRRRR